MKNHIIRYFSVVAVFSLAFLTVHSAQAVSVTYTFEQSALGTTTPILAASPDSGPASFQATFTSAPTPNDFQVSNAILNSLFSGKNLQEFTLPSDTLTVSLNMPINSVSLVFATDSMGGSNSLSFFSTAGNTSAASTAQNGGQMFDGGVLTFSNAIPFTSFSLNTGGSGRFAIDNLVMNTADGIATLDTGSTLMLLALATFSLFGLHRRFSKQLVSC